MSYDPQRVILNWGHSNPPVNVAQHEMINPWQQVAKCVNKLKFFELMKETRVPEWTTDVAKAAEWFEDGHIVVGRQKLTGHSGEGIVIMDPETCDICESAPDCKLYTKYVKKKDEYRIHVADGVVFFEQRKARKKGVPDEDVDWKVRNTDGGFIYAWKNIQVPDDVREQALSAYHESGLDFCAVDVLWNEHESKAYVLEVNCAPGIVGETLSKYTDMIKDMCETRGIEIQWKN